MTIKHVFQSLTINASLLGLLASSASIAVSPNFWGKAADCAEKFNAPGLASGLREMVPVVTGMSAVGAIAGRLRKGGLAFWTPDGLPGPDRDAFLKGEPDINQEIRVVQDQNALGNKAINHLIDTVQGLQSRLDQLPVVDDIRGTIETAVRSGQQVALPPVEMGERQPDKIIDLTRNKLMEMI